MAEPLIQDGSYFHGMMERLRWTGETPFAIGDREVRTYGYSSDVGVVLGFKRCGLAFPQVVVEWPPSTRRKKNITRVFAKRLMPVTQNTMADAHAAQRQWLSATVFRAAEDLHWQTYATSLTGGGGTDG